MKKNKKAYGYYWIRENEYENILTKKANIELANTLIPVYGKMYR